jgi:hypothetical protein
VKCCENKLKIQPIERNQMKTIKKNWTKFAGLFSLASLAVCAVYACVSAFGQTAPGLKIAMTNTVVSLTVTNGATNGLYHIYFTDDVGDPDWVLLTNGVTGQTNFSADMGDLEMGYFKAINNDGFTSPTITVIIQAPANGSTVY